MYTGPHLIKDKLVFGYDTGYGVADNNTATRFYPGKPISNSINGGANRANVVTAPMHGSHGASVTTEIISYGARKNVFRIYSTNTSGYYMVNQQSSIINTSGNVYTYSFDYKKIKGTSTSFSPSAFYKNGYKTPDSGTAASSVTDTVVDLEDGWKRLTRTYTSSYSGYNFYRTNLNTNDTLDFEYLFDNFMVNEGVAVPFADSTRSSTASLIDLKKTTNINVSNISFDSTGQPTFDGTDDIVNTGLFSGRNPATDPFTIEAIVKSDTTSGARMWLDATSNGSGQRLYCAHAATGTGTPMGIQSSGWSSSGVHDTDFHHYVVVMDGSVARLYNNGEAHSTKNYTSYQIQALTVGGRSGYRWVGTVPVFKIHNQVLTADQVKQNYRAYKNRFGI